MAEPAVVAENLTRTFGRFTAVDRVSFAVERGKIYGFLGANGAGKSTAIRMLCGLLSPTAGTARVAGYDVVREPDRVKERIGYMSQKFSLYNDLTVMENITFYGGVYGLAPEQIRRRAAWALDMAGLHGREESLTRELAGGWKQRLALGCAILHEPQIVFLDEPTSGVDPVSRRNFWELIHTLADRGTTVLVTTHYLDEAEYCHTILLIHAGRLVAQGGPGELKARHITHPILEVRCDRPIAAMELLQKADWAVETSVFGTNLHVTVATDQETGQRRVRELLTEHDIRLESTAPVVPTLEDVFIHLIERQNKEV